MRQPLQKSLPPCYLLFGNDPLLLQESLDRIRDLAQSKQFDEHFNITLDTSTDWDAIFRLCQARSLFTSRQTLLIILPEGNLLPLNGEERLLKLASLLHEDLLLILSGRNLTRSLENSPWFKAISQQAVLITCATPEQTQLPKWVSMRAKSMNLMLDDASCQLLCYCYEGNLLALVQALVRLSLIYPDGNLSLSRVESAVNNAAHFFTFHWIEATLAGNSNRATHILRQLRLESVEPVILLRSIQREVLLLLKLKRHMTTTPILTLFKHHKIWKTRQAILTQSLDRLTHTQLRDIVALMTKIELAFKQNYGYPVWSDLNALTLLLCGQSLPKVMIDG